jgi:predicted ArsR family transcriptional regulator
MVTKTYAEEQFLLALDATSPKPTLLIAQTVGCSMTTARDRLNDMLCRDLVSRLEMISWSGRPEYQWCKK